MFTHTTAVEAAAATPQSASARQTAPTAQWNGQQHTLRDGNDRVGLVVPRSPLPLAEPYDLLLGKKAAGLTSVDVLQRVRRGTGKEVEIVQRESLPVQHGPGGEAFVRITPLRLGTVEIGLTGLFQDGAILHKVIPVQVEPGKDPKALRAGNGFSPEGDIPFIAMRLEHPVGNMLSPNATYDGIEDPVRIDPRFAKFKITTKDNRQIISLDPATGIIRPMEVGHALVQTFFGGLSTYTCVAVVSTQEGTSFAHTECKELLPPGVKLSGSR